MRMLLSVVAALAMLAPGQECVGFVAENLAKGSNNFYEYFRISDQQVKVRVGDVLVYDIFLDPKNPQAKGGLDIDFGGDSALRDRGLLDQNGLRAHGDAILTAAVGKWYSRRIRLDAAAGLTATSWNLVFEGDENGRYAQFVDNVGIQHADGTTDWIVRNGTVKTRLVVNRSGYTAFPSCSSVDRTQVETNLDGAIASVVKDAKRFQALLSAHSDIEFAEKFVKQNPNPHLLTHVLEARAQLDLVESRRNATEAEIEGALHTVKNALQHTHTVMQSYTGHLVGHAHIDLQWLWDWQEGLVATRDTFNQAIKFMDEFPGFTFSQSSSALYKTTEEHYPALFKKIQQKVKAGQWEIVGGRICEGDTNMISPESQARQFLYAQRYFREKFGKTAVVGWEPDTFGHSIQMPQILKLGGCNYYYFCRGGKEKPLFWWQGLDGTKVLAFDEPASGSWYNSDLSYKQFQEMLDFKNKVGSKDMLWVYGVGNHGGGPTREMIEEALGWIKDPSKPKVKFSTATEFFKKLETYDLKRIPVIRDELNPVFEGCYTSHSEIKQLNRQAEYNTVSAEAVSAVASLVGFNYPKATFRQNWEDIGFHHHHDTLPGSGIHSPYEKTKTQLSRVIAEDKDIQQRAMETLAIRVTPVKDRLNYLVFNPTGWTRSGWVETYAVGSGWGGGGIDTNRPIVAVAPDGKEYPCELLESVSRRVRFLAGDVPGYGYRVFVFKNVDTPKPAERMEIDVPETLSNDKLEVRFNNELGAIDQIIDKRTGEKRQFVANGGTMGRLEMNIEKPHGMSAWALGEIGHTETLKMSSVSRGLHSVTFTTYQESFNHPGHLTEISQTYRLLPGSDQIEVTVDCDWQGLGNGQTGNPWLRVAFDTALNSPTATYEVPFGAITRPANGQEVVGLNWQDLSDAQAGVAVINDSKSGMSASGSTMRLSLIRSSYDPDPEPNPGVHKWHYAIVPHSGDWRTAGIVKRGQEFNLPMLISWVPFDARGDQPLELSTVNVSDPNVVTTALKRSEDGNDLVLRFYQARGANSVGSINLLRPIKSASWVNFLEDTLGVATVSGSKVAAPLHPYEIKTLKATLK